MLTIIFENDIVYTLNINNYFIFAFNGTNQQKHDNTNNTPKNTNVTIIQINLQHHEIALGQHNVIINTTYHKYHPKNNISINNITRQHHKTTPQKRHHIISHYSWLGSNITCLHRFLENASSDRLHKRNGFRFAIHLHRLQERDLFNTLIINQIQLIHERCTHELIFNKSISTNISSI